MWVFWLSLFRSQSDYLRKIPEWTPSVFQNWNLLDKGQYTDNFYTDSICSCRPIKIILISRTNFKGFYTEIILARVENHSDVRIATCYSSYGLKCSLFLKRSSRHIFVKTGKKRCSEFCGIRFYYDLKTLRSRYIDRNNRIWEANLFATDRSQSWAYLL